MSDFLIRIALTTYLTSGIVSLAVIVSAIVMEDDDFVELVNELGKAKVFWMILVVVTMPGFNTYYLVKIFKRAIAYVRDEEQEGGGHE